MKGHPLVWHSYYPKWRPDDPLEAMVRTEQHITEIASRYGDSIKRWEVVNEPCERRTWEVKWCNLPEDYVFRSFDTAAKCFPAGDRLMINEAPTFSWVEFYGTESRYYGLIRELLGRSARVDEIGFQFHIMKEPIWREILAGQNSAPGREGMDEKTPLIKSGYYFTPSNVFKVLDRYGDFGRPLAITEITFPTLPNTPEGERYQAILARNFYRLWFSHPNVNAITWWNVVDGTAIEVQDKLHGGLLNRDLSLKPAFTALDQLINHDWKTKFETNCATGGEVSFRGFHGDYTVTAKSGSKTVKQTFRLKKGTEPNEWTVSF